MTGGLLHPQATNLATIDAAEYVEAGAQHLSVGSKHPFDLAPARTLLEAADRIGS